MIQIEIWLTNHGFWWTPRWSEPYLGMYCFSWMWFDVVLDKNPEPHKTGWKQSWWDTRTEGIEQNK